MPSTSRAASDFSRYNISAIYHSIKNIADQTSSNPVDALFKIQDGKLVEFNPGSKGIDLDVKSSIDAVVGALQQSQSSAELAVNEIEAKIKLADTNNMGINELIAAGSSNFGGSPNNRVFNIKVGANKEGGTILAPGETFSFNNFLGPVDGEHGFLPELVIKQKEGTVPEFGGGLCQVSSTMFRAAMNAGFPIPERRNHSYAVSYYAPQGTDATIYPGVQDLKFINNSPAHILIWAEFPSKSTLRFSIYGTKDSRQVTFEGPKSYDQKPDGSLKATWTRTTTMPDGKIIKEVFKSTYLSPALFHKEMTYPTVTAAPGTAPSSPPATEPSTNPSPPKAL